MQHNMMVSLLLALALTACASTKQPLDTPAVISVCPTPSAEMLTMPPKPAAPVAGYHPKTFSLTPATTGSGASN